MDTPLRRRRSRHLAGRLALAVLGVASTSTTSGNNSGSSQQEEQCAMTARVLLVPALPSAAAFVPPSSTAAVSNHRTRILNRRTVPLVLKDPTDVGGQTTSGSSGGGGDGYPPETANSAAGPENSYASPSTTNTCNCDAGPIIGASTTIDPLLELEDPEEYLNREFANNLILGSDGGFWNSGDGSAGAKSLEEEEEEEVAILEEEDDDESRPTAASSSSVLGSGDLDPYLAEHRNGAAAEQWFLETVVREGDHHHLVRVEGIPPLSLEEEEALSGNDDRFDACASSTTTPTTTTPTTSVATPTSTTTTTTPPAPALPYQIPTLSQIVRFALPATAIYLCDPLLSLIDTAAVGWLARSTAHQAALSPAIAVVNYSALLLAFLFVGATNFVAQAATRTTKGGAGAGAGAGGVGAAATKGGSDSGGVEAAGNNDQDNDKDKGKTKEEEDKDTAAASAGPAQILLSTLQISFHTGTLLGGLLFVLAPTLIALLTGGRGSLPPAVFQPAVQYVRIRALGFPAAAVLGSAQAACLGLRDTATPLLVLGAAAVLNVVGDLSLVGIASNPWLFGAAGAAWATTLGQVAAVGLFLRLLQAKPKATPKPKPKAKPKPKVDKRVGEDDDAAAAAAAASSSKGGSSGRWSLTRMVSRRRSSAQTAVRGGADMTAELPSGTGDAGDADGGDAISARGFLAEHNFEPHHILRLPSRSTVRQFLPYVLPVTTTSVGRVSLFLSMAHVVSSCMGVAGMAAQTIALGIFDALCPLSQSLTLAAQAFVPGALEEQERLRRVAAAAEAERGAEAEAEATSSSGAAAAAEQQRNPSHGDDVLARFSRQFLKAGGAFGLFTALCATSIPFVSGLMTTDAAVASQIAAVTPHLAAIFALHGLVMSAEGVLLGKEDVNFLGCMYGAFFVIMPAWMMRVKHGALHLGQAAGLGSVWSVFLMYQLVRSILWAGRAAMPTKDR